MNLLPLGTSAILCVMIAGCAHTHQRFKREYSTREAQVAKVQSLLAASFESSFANGPLYSLTVLRGMRAASELGPEGSDASALWEQQIEQLFRADRAQTRADLHEEVRGYDDILLADVLAVIAPQTRNPRWSGPVRSPKLIGWSVELTRAMRNASLRATCRSLDTTPKAWAVKYPDRRAFSFERFGVNKALIDTWCKDRTALGL